MQVGSLVLTNPGKAYSAAPTVVLTPLFKSQWPDGATRPSRWPGFSCPGSRRRPLRRWSRALPSSREACYLRCAPKEFRMANEEPTFPTIEDYEDDEPAAADVVTPEEAPARVLHGRPRGIGGKKPARPALASQVCPAGWILVSSAHGRTRKRTSCGRRCSRR